MRKENLNIRLPQGFRQRLRGAARAQNKTVTDFVIESLDEAIKKTMPDYKTIWQKTVRPGEIVSVASPYFCVAGYEDPLDPQRSYVAEYRLSEGKIFLATCKYGQGEVWSEFIEYGPIPEGLPKWQEKGI